MSGNREGREREREMRTAKKPRKYNTRMDGGKESKKNGKHPGIGFELLAISAFRSFSQTGVRAYSVQFDLGK